MAMPNMPKIALMVGIHLQGKNKFSCGFSGTIRVLFLYGVRQETVLTFQTGGAGKVNLQKSGGVEWCGIGRRVPARARKQHWQWLL